MRSFCLRSTSTMLAFVLMNSLTIDWRSITNGQTGAAWLQGMEQAEAKRSGGRSRGGSFSGGSSSGSSSSGSSSSGKSAGGSSSNRKSSGQSSGSTTTTPNRSQPVIPHSPNRKHTPHIDIDIEGPEYDEYGNEYEDEYGTAADGAALLISLVILLLVLGGGAVLAFALFKWWRSKQTGVTGGKAGNRELNNDIVTVTQLQVALLGDVSDIQAELDMLAANADTSNRAGLTELLRETTLLLLRSNQHWSHAHVQSQTLKTRQAAAQLFEQLSIEQRSKVEVETLVNVGGKVQRRNNSADDDLSSGYLVVTLHIGTEDDQPLFGAIHTLDELRSALQRLAGISSDYLLILELLWSPEGTDEKLSSDDLLMHYPDMLQLG